MLYVLFLLSMLMLKELISLMTGCSKGKENVSFAEDYTSHNTEQLDVSGVKELLIKLPFVQSALYD